MSEQKAGENTHSIPVSLDAKKTEHETVPITSFAQLKTAFLDGGTVVAAEREATFSCTTDGAIHTFLNTSTGAGNLNIDALVKVELPSGRKVSIHSHPTLGPHSDLIRLFTAEHRRNELHIIRLDPATADETYRTDTGLELLPSVSPVFATEGDVPSADLSFTFGTDLVFQPHAIAVETQVFTGAGGAVNIATQHGLTLLIGSSNLEAELRPLIDDCTAFQERRTRNTKRKAFRQKVRSLFRLPQPQRNDRFFYDEEIKIQKNLQNLLDTKYVPRWRLLRSGYKADTEFNNKSDIGVKTDQPAFLDEKGIAVTDLLHFAAGKRLRLLHIPWNFIEEHTVEIGNVQGLLYGEGLHVIADLLGAEYPELLDAFVAKNLFDALEHLNPAEGINNYTTLLAGQ